MLCTGCFDILHVGHLYYLKAAKYLGDMLVVGVTGDDYISKGPGRPVFLEEQRAFMLEELRCVDVVKIYHEKIPYDLISKIKPSVYAKGSEYRGKLPEQELVESLGGRCEFIDTPVYSSTKLLEVL